MDYPAYRQAGLFIASGAMESVSIYMMQDRMRLLEMANKGIWAACVNIEVISGRK